MGEAISNFRKRKRAKELLDECLRHPENVIVVHYSCESFYDRANGASPRITSIAVRNLESGFTTSFSIHQAAEVRGFSRAELEEKYDELERQMLDEFYEYVRQHQKHRWIHWNMRDSNYGFPAIEHRYKVLGGEPIHLHETKLFDLSRGLFAIYGRGYISHPRLEKLMDKNDISRLQFLTGAEEAMAFKAEEYVKLHQSTLRKVDVLASVAIMAQDGSLKTDSKWRERYGLSPAVIVEWMKENKLISFFAGLIALISAILGIVSYFKQ